MTLQDFVIRVNGPRFLSLSETDEPLCPHDFYVKYRMQPEWTSKIDRIDLIPHKDQIICLITLEK